MPEITDTTVEEYKEANGPVWVYTYENYTLKRPEILKALKDRVTIIEGSREPETTEESAAETESAE